MSVDLPSYDSFVQSLSLLELPISASELHGVLCAYLVAGKERLGDEYLRALTLSKPKASVREAAQMLFNVYTVSQQQLSHLGFEFQLMLPDDASLYDRARAFSEWCEGFSQGITVANVNFASIDNEEIQEAVQHITDFAQLDYEKLDVNEEDERSLVEVIEYTRVAVLHLYMDLKANARAGKNIAH